MSEKIVTIGDEQTRVRIEREGGHFTVRREGKTDEIELLSAAGNEAVLRVNGRVRRVPYVIRNSAISFVYDGETYAAEVAERGGRQARRHGEHSLAAPMPGVVLKLLASAGQAVAKGTPLVILEAMKMEHQIVAPYDGVVRAVHCEVGEMVQPGVDLISLERSGEKDQ
jgi:biotin carboxyl carrier protein